MNGLVKSSYSDHFAVFAVVSPGKLGTSTSLHLVPFLSIPSFLIVCGWCVVGGGGMLANDAILPTPQIPWSGMSLEKIQMLGQRGLHQIIYIKK